MREQSDLSDGVRIVDRRGRRWYTQAYRDEVVEQCCRPGVSVAAIALEHGLNANLVRKWITKQDAAVRPVSLVPVRIRPQRDRPVKIDHGGAIVIRQADIEVVLRECAGAEQIEAVIRALR